MSDKIVDLGIMSPTQCFPLYYYEKVKKENKKTNLFAELEPKAEPSLFDEEYEYIKKEAVRNEALKKFQEVYNDKNITKKDIFYYIYGILHSNEYKERFKDNLSKQLPRIPFAKDFFAFSQIGLQLANIHIDYESIEPNKIAKIVKKGENDDLFKTDINDLEDTKFIVIKMKFDKRSKGGKSRIFYNEHITIDNIPLKAYEYIVNGKSAIEWIMDRYQISINKDSGIKNDPNLYSDNSKYIIIKLLMSVIELSIQSVDLIKQLPKIDEISS